MFPAHAGMNRFQQLGLIGSQMFPAHAGMNRWGYPVKLFGANVPRTRGDEPARGT